MPEVKVENRPGTSLQQRTGNLAPFGEYLPITRDIFANPFALMRRLSEEMDRAFSTSLGLGREMGAWWPAVEVKERDGNLMIWADLPGLKKEDVKVEYTPEGLLIHGERKIEHEEAKGGYNRTERHYGQFYRTIPLPEGVNVDKAQAQFKEGVLEVRIPLPENLQHKIREIPIKS